MRSSSTASFAPHSLVALARRSFAAGLLVASLAAASLAAAGCAGAIDPGANTRAASSSTRAATVPAPPPVPVLEFDANWQVQQSNSVISGGDAIIHYDIARLPNCRATYEEFPAWDVLAYWSTDGGPAYSQSLTTVSGTTRTATDITIAVPPGRDFAMWFYASDENGCVQWDSNYGRNFHFPTEPGPPTIHFPWPGFGFTVDGPLVNEVMIDYDVRRLYECRGAGANVWDVFVSYSFDGAPAQQLSLTSLGQNGRVAAPALFAVPDGARSLAVWFENDDNTGCRAWDSRYGSNYVFTVP